MNDMITIEKASVYEDVYTPPRQSADTLFRFVEKLEYLLDTIEKDALVPRYCRENTNYLNIRYSEIAYPMLCFCDINMHRLEEHMEFYGGYGIAFSKQWGIDKGIQPIQYVNPKSYLKQDFTEAFDVALNSQDTDKVQNYLLTQMYFLKPIEGEMPRNGKLEHKNFTDECEWRFVPNVISQGFPGVLIGSDIVRRDTLNEGICHTEQLWLKYSVNDVKYIILKSRKEFEQVIEIILQKEQLKDEEKYDLISKVVIWEESKGDF